MMVVMSNMFIVLMMSKGTGENDGDDDDVSDVKYDDDDAVDDGEKHLDTVMGAAGEATENTLSGMGGQ